MGLRGLTTFFETTGGCLEPYELRDTYLVIDGGSVSKMMWRTASGQSFCGGDHCAFYDEVKRLFGNLRQCNVKPLIILNGVNLSGSRNEEWLSKLRSLMAMQTRRTFQNHTSSEALPTMLHAAADCKVPVARVLFDALRESAAVARSLNCPVLSYHSMFFLFDVTYIPFSTLIMDPVRSESSDRYHLKCSKSDSSSIFKRSDRSILPLLAALLRCESRVFGRFIDHVVPHERFSYVQRAAGIIKWLSEQESLESATEEILSHVEEGEEDAGRGLIARELEYLEIGEPTVLAHLGVDAPCCEAQSDETERLRDVLPGVTDEMIENFRKGEVVVWLLRSVFFNHYCLPVGIEDLREASAALLCLPLITSQLFIMKAVCGVQENHIWVTMRLKNGAWEEKNLVLMNNRLRGVNPKDILHESISVRRQLFYRIADVRDQDGNALTEVFGDSDWLLFAVSLVYYMKQSNPAPTEAALHSILLTGVAVYAKMGRVGVDSQADGTLPARFHSVPESELAKLAQVLSHLERPDPELARADDALSLMHGYSTFTFCCTYLASLNELLRYPFLHLKLHKFLASGLRFSLHVLLNRQPDAMSCVNDILAATPTIRGVYQFLCDKLTRYLRREDGWRRCGNYAAGRPPRESRSERAWR